VVQRPPRYKSHHYERWGSVEGGSTNAINRSTTKGGGASNLLVQPRIMSDFLDYQVNIVLCGTSNS
jgi:hypothetical protein